MIREEIRNGVTYHIHESFKPMRAQNKIWKLKDNLNRRGIDLTLDEVSTLRRCEMTLHRWHEQECGDSNNYMSWVIIRDEETGKPFLENHSHQGGRTTRTPIRDLEKGALARVSEICTRHGLHYWQQGDPRGCALYISKEPMTDSNYSSIGVAVCD
jgi:hypothetical protein